jgi:hypothetical protein
MAQLRLTLISHRATDGDNELWIALTAYPHSFNVAENIVIICKTTCECGICLAFKLGMNVASLTKLGEAALGMDGHPRPLARPLTSRAA